MRSAAILALVGAVAAQYKGFNYGATNPDGSVRVQGDYENLFNAAKNLAGTSGFTSARLYTMIQGSTTDSPTSAIQAAIDTKTTLLLGLWASAGQTNIDNEIAALKTAMQQHGTEFTSLVAGISVGSEDLYRISPTGIENKSGVGAGPDVLVSYIKQLRAAIQGTALSGATVGHVDTWTAWVNGSNAAVIDAVDWLGVDSYPYFETTVANSIENGADLFFQSYNATVDVAGGKPVWITETGWPVQGPTSGQAVASTQNAETYWQEVGCRVLGNVNTWWYTLYDPEADGAVGFGLQSQVGGTPVIDLTCKAGSSSAASSSTGPTSSSAAATSGAAAMSATASSYGAAPAVGSSSAAASAGSSGAEASFSAAAPIGSSGATSVVSVIGGKTTMVAVGPSAAATSGHASGTGAVPSSGPATPSASTQPYTGAAATLGFPAAGLAVAGLVALLL